MKVLKLMLAIFLINLISLPVFAHDENHIEWQLFHCPLTDALLQYEEADLPEQKIEALNLFEDFLSQRETTTHITQLQNQQNEIYDSLFKTAEQLKAALNSDENYIEKLENRIDEAKQKNLETQLQAQIFKHLEFEKTVSDIKSEQVWKITYALIVVLFVFIATTIFFIFIYNNAKRVAKKQKIFTNQMLQAQEEERARISRELHDTLTQDLRTSLLFIHELSEKITDESTNEYQLVSKINMLQTQNLKTIRNIIQNLTPAEMRTANLKNLLIDYCGNVMQMSNLRCTFFAEENLDFSKFTEIQKLNIFRIVQEAITNSIKHAHASEVNILVRGDRENPEKMIFFISDDGCGFNPDTAAVQTSSFDKSDNPLTNSTHMGLNGMKKRAHILNAELKITSDEECGTEIRLEV